jgi:nucleotide-binding universal stress UspA family protein
MIKEILVAVDDSSAAFRAAAVAVDLAAALRAHLVAVSVVDGAAAEEPRLTGGVGIIDELEAVRGVQSHVRALAARAGVPLEIRTVRGRVADQLLEAARHVGADLVVVGRVDRPGLRLTHVGRTAEQVLEFCEVPVLVVPASREDTAPAHSRTWGR